MGMQKLAWALSWEGPVNQQLEQGREKHHHFKKSSRFDFSPKKWAHNHVWWEKLGGRRVGKRRTWTPMDWQPLRFTGGWGGGQANHYKERYNRVMMQIIMDWMTQNKSLNGLSCYCQKNPTFPGCMMDRTLLATLLACGWNWQSIPLQQTTVGYVSSLAF